MKKLTLIFGIGLLTLSCSKEIAPKQTSTANEEEQVFVRSRFDKNKIITLQERIIEDDLAGVTKTAPVLYGKIDCWIKKPGDNTAHLGSMCTAGGSGCAVGSSCKL